MGRSDQKILPVFVGSGIMEAELKTAAKELKVDAHFEGFKNQTELPLCYAASDVVVLPSDAGETWGLVVNEAMACGRPAIVSNAVGCAPDLIEEGQTGFTFPLGNVARLASRLVEISTMYHRNFDFAVPLAAKMRCYSLDTATDGTVRAVNSVRSAQGEEILSGRAS
jgi:glycosyltransferase involved in cell wall biosynthesis